MKVFSTKYTVQLGGRLIHLSCIWHSVLVSFAVAIVNCITTKAKELVFEPGVTPGTVREALRNHLKQDHPHLLASFDERLRFHGQDVHLTWNGPAFDVIRKTDTFHAITSALGIAEHKQAFGLGQFYEGSNTPAALNEYYAGIWPGEEAGDNKVDVY